MKSFNAFFKKELLENIRSGRLIILGIIFIALGIMNPAIAKLTPLLMEIMSEELASNGIVMSEISVDALTSWTQFFKNIPIGLIAFVVMLGNTFTKEYEAQTLIPIITKGLSRYKVVLAKSLDLFLLWSVGYLLSFGITYIYNAYYWDNSIAVGLLSSAVNWWLFGCFIISLIVLLSVLLKGCGYVLLGCGGIVVILYLLSFIPRFSGFLPNALINFGELITGEKSVLDFSASIVITVIVMAFAVIASIPIFNKKQL